MEWVICNEVEFPSRRLCIRRARGTEVEVENILGKEVAGFEERTMKMANDVSQQAHVENVV